MAFCREQTRSRRLGVVVRIEQVFTQFPLASFHPSHNPAKANNSPLFSWSKEIHRKLHSSLPRDSRLRWSAPVCGRELRRQSPATIAAHCYNDYPVWAMEWDRSNCTQSAKNTIIKTQVAKCSHRR